MRKYKRLFALNTTIRLCMNTNNAPNKPEKTLKMKSNNEVMEEVKINIIFR